MTLEELKKLNADDEGETVEVKETTGQRSGTFATLLLTVSWFVIL